nr:hypothetical protein [Rhodoferax sp.]
MGWIDEMLVGVPVNAVLRERLTLEAEKRGATIAENVALKSENISLRSENEVLKSQAVNLRQEIQRRDDVIEQEKTHGHTLEKLREKILVLVAQHERLHDAQIAEEIGVSKQLATLHLQELKTANFVSSHFALDEDSRRVDAWFIEQPGRKYLLNHGLL